MTMIVVVRRLFGYYLLGKTQSNVCGFLYLHRSLFDLRVHFVTSN